MRSLKDYILLFLKGIGMGGADVVPGVSGGTIAFITGIYEELLNTIKSFDAKALKILLSGDLKSLWKHVNGNFLVALLSGIAISIFTLAKAIHFFLENYPIQLWSFFFGLIIISAITVTREIKQWNIKLVIGVIIGTLVAYFITALTPASTPENYFFIFLSGAIAICAMILPGISGSFILLILGKYEYVIAAINDLNILVIVIFGLGCIIGILSFSRLISWLLDHYHDISIAVLAGFMLGSLNKIWPWKETLSYRMNSKGVEVPFLQENVLPTEYLSKTGSDPEMLYALLFAAVGVLIVIIIEKIAAVNKDPKKELI